MLCKKKTTRKDTNRNLYSIINMLLFYAKYRATSVKLWNKEYYTILWTKHQATVKMLLNAKKYT